MTQPTPTPIDPALNALHVEVAARVGTVGVPAAWSAHAAWGASPLVDARGPGVCGAPDAVVQNLPSALVESVQLTGPAAATLTWDDAHGLFTAEGPRQTLDPAWGIGDLHWQGAEGESYLAEGVVRFGAMPEITQVSRDREGGITLAWDATTVSQPEISVRGPAGELVCGAGPGGVTLPWWVVPASGGEVVLRSTHVERGLVDGVLLEVHSTLERVVPLDQPAGTTADEKPLPSRGPPVPAGPRRVQRAARKPVG